MSTQETRAEAPSSARIEPDDATTAAVQPRTVIVPRRPGMLREHQPRARRRRDELDDLIDGLFGPTTDEKPGRFDAGLVVVGLGLAAWAVGLGGPSVALWIGIAAIVLGVALPVRALVHRFDSSPSGALRRLLGGDLPLDTSHPATMALVGAYARLMQVSCLQGTGNPKQAVLAGHAGVAEAARRLDGRPPETPAQVSFVSTQTAALEGLTRQMLHSRERSLALAASQAPTPTARAHSTPRQVPIQDRWMPPPAQTRPPIPRSPTTSPGRRP